MVCVPLQSLPGPDPWGPHFLQHVMQQHKDVNHHLLELNKEIILHLSALQDAKFLKGNHGQVPRKTHGLLILYLNNPTTVNNCISCQITLHGRLLPAVRFAQCLLCCSNFQHTGHYACSCVARTMCGFCTGDHDTRQCGDSQKDGQGGQFAPLKCVVCGGPHAMLDTSCSVCRVVVDEHKAAIADTGCYAPCRS